MVYAYVRVSTNYQTVQNQKLAIKEYAKYHRIHKIQWIAETISGTKSPEKRNLGLLLNKVQKDDVIIITELSRLGRTMTMILNVLQTLLDKGVKVIELLRLDKSDNDFVFVYMNKPLTTSFLLDHFKCVLRKNDIDCEDRNITIHSLRFTYNSLLRGEISGDDLRLMVGHTDERMTEYYDKSKAIEHLDDLLLNKNTLNSVFN